MFALIVAREADRHEARARCHERGTGRDLIVVKQAVIDEALAKLGMRFGKPRATGLRIASTAFEVGQAAGRNLRINLGVKMAGDRWLDREAK